MYFLVWTKGSHQSSNFDIFKCSGENSPKFLMSFPNHKSVFLQIRRDSSVSCKITRLHFFRSNMLYLAQNEPIKMEIFEKPNFLSLFKQQISFSSNFASLFSAMRHNSSVLFQLKFHILSTKGAYHSTNLAKFHVNSQKYEIWRFVQNFS